MVNGWHFNQCRNHSFSYLNQPQSCGSTVMPFLGAPHQQAPFVSRFQALILPKEAALEVSWEITQCTLGICCGVPALGLLNKNWSWTGLRSDQRSSERTKPSLGYSQRVVEPFRVSTGVWSRDSLPCWCFTCFAFPLRPQNFPQGLISVAGLCFLHNTKQWMNEWMNECGTWHVLDHPKSKYSNYNKYK